MLECAKKIVIVIRSFLPLQATRLIHTRNAVQRETNTLLRREVGNSE